MPRLQLRYVALLVWLTFLLAGPVHGGNDVLGEVELIGATKVEKTSGVWVDDQYLGYLNELKGSKKILLLPGRHEIVVRQAGYTDFAQQVLTQPGAKQVIRVTMQKDPRVQLPTVTAAVKLSVSPNRAAVFVDGGFVGHVDEFDGPGQAMLIAPGKHKITISLPGYQTFETEVTLNPEQQFQLKTDLQKTGSPQDGLPSNRE
jgi:PEGA domain